MSTSWKRGRQRVPFPCFGSHVYPDHVVEGPKTVAPEVLATEAPIVVVGGVLSHV